MRGHGRQADCAACRLAGVQVLHRIRLDQ
jgi:hypothetical protein